MKTYSSLVESIPAKTIIFAYGRCNPFTSGHLVLASKVLSKAKLLKADHEFILSKSHDTKKNPLDPIKKLYWAKRFAPNINFKLATDSSPSFIQAVESYSGKYRNLIMIAGSDRVEEFTTKLKKYNGTTYNFDSISVISAGERDPDSDDVFGMSGSKLRGLAALGDKDKFIKSLDLNLSNLDSIRYMNDIRIGLGLTQITEHVEITPVKSEEEFIRGKSFTLGQMVTDGSSIFEVVNLGPNYATVISENRIIQKRWFSDLSPSDIVTYIDFFNDENITKNINNSFILSEKHHKNGDFNDKMALVLAYRQIEQYYQNGDINTIIKAKDLLENINQLDNHLYIKEILEMTDAPKGDYESIDGHSIDNTHDHDANSIDTASDEELDHIIKTHLSDDDFYNEYDEDELCYVDAESGEEVELESPEGLTEVLSRMERMRSSIRFHRTESKRGRKLEIALRKRSDSATLNKRARRLAVKAVERRLAKKPLASLTVSEKERIEQRISRMKPVLSRLALRLIPKVKQLEADRLNRKK